MGKSPESKADHHVIAGWSGAMLDQGVLWLVLISLPYLGEVGKHQRAVQGQGSAFWHAVSRGELQESSTIRRHHEVHGKGLFRERRAERYPACREVSGIPAPWAAQAPAGTSSLSHSKLMEEKMELRGKSMWIGACLATCVVGGGYGAPALACPHNTCSCMPHAWHAAVWLSLGCSHLGHPTMQVSYRYIFNGATLERVGEGGLLDTILCRRVTSRHLSPFWCSARAGFTLHPQGTIKCSHPMGQLVPLQHLA